MISKISTLTIGALALSFAASGVAHADTVYANNQTTGDNFSFNLGGIRSGAPLANSAGWYYNNVGGGGVVGVNGKNPHDGNGSVSFSGSGTNSKADIEYLGNNASRGFLEYSSTTTFGPFAALSGMSYDWYRNSTSTATSTLHPSLRVLLDLDGNLTTTNDRGGLVFELAYNGGGAVPTNQWVTSTVGASTNLWNFGLGLGTGFNIKNTGYGYDTTLAQWQAYAPNATIIGFSSGIGSGWGPFAGAVDNIGWTIAGKTTQTNFELKASANAVPEPGSLALVAFGLIGLAASRKRKAV